MEPLITSVEDMPPSAVVALQIAADDDQLGDEDTVVAGSNNFFEYEEYDTEQGVEADPADELVSFLSVKPEDKYKFQNSVAHGGMKTILRVRDKDTARNVAMAVLLHGEDAKGKRSNLYRRFVQEARITANLEHPNIVPVHDIGVDEAGSPYFTMKLIKGETLANIIRRLNVGDEAYVKKYNLTALLLVYRKIINAIAFAHSKGIVHLDVTPENVQVGRFGEVLVLDWGLAKVLGKPDEEPPPPGKRPARSGSETQKRVAVNPSLTLDGVVKGTPGYMAPEQAEGMNSLKDERTDIYALGGILYAMLTFKNPMHSGNLEETLDKTIHGKIKPPRERAPERQISSALDAVVMKAMARRAERRYQNVMDLRDDVDAFIGGFATSAEKATWLRKGLLFCRRHQLATVLVSLISILAFFFGRFVIVDQIERSADWTAAYQGVFVGGDIESEGVSLVGANMAGRGRRPELDTDGLVPRIGEWLWLDDVSIPGDNARVAVTIVYMDEVDTLDISLNARRSPSLRPHRQPLGYTAVFAVDGGAKAGISRIAADGDEVGVMVPLARRVERNRRYRVVFERLGDSLTLLVNGMEVASFQDLMPLAGEAFSGVAIRSRGGDVRIRKIEVSRLRLPEKSSPLVAGDALAEAGHYNDAVAKYLSISENYGVGQIAERALVKAYLTASIREVADAEAKLAAIRGEIERRFPNFAFKNRILELDATRLWRSGDFTQAIALWPRIFELDPETGIVVRLLGGTAKPPAELSAGIMPWLARTRSLQSVNIADMGITDLTPIARASIEYLDCSNNSIGDLAPLRGMPLRDLRCANNQLESLAPLAGGILHSLDCSGNPVTSLAPLIRLPLRFLDISGCAAIEDLTPLLEIRTLERLVVPMRKGGGLEVLRGHPGIRRLGFDADHLVPTEEFWSAFDAAKPAE